MTRSVLVSFNPSTEERLGTIQQSSPESVDGVLARAVTGFRSEWSKDSPLRAQALFAWAAAIEEQRDSLAAFLTQETGKILAYKFSGIGRTRGIEGIEQFTEVKHINWQG